MKKSNLVVGKKYKLHVPFSSRPKLCVYLGYKGGKNPFFKSHWFKVDKDLSFGLGPDSPELKKFG